jgi:hypothetical protein
MSTCGLPQLNGGSGDVKKSVRGSQRAMDSIVVIYTKRIGNSSTAFYHSATCSARASVTPNIGSEASSETR